MAERVFVSENTVKTHCKRGLLEMERRPYRMAAIGWTDAARRAGSSKAIRHYGTGVESDPASIFVSASRLAVSRNTVATARTRPFFT